MNDLEKKLMQCSREVRETYILKKEERFRVSENVLLHAPASPEQPLKKKISSPYHKVRFPHFLFMNYASIVLVFVFVFTGMLSYVADRSLPGDPLYVVKTHVNENIQSLLTFSPQSKAQLQVTLTKTHLGEAEQLAIDDRMSTTTEAMLAVDFKNDLDGFKQSIDQVGASSGLVSTSTATTSADIAIGTSSPDQVEGQAEAQIEDLTDDQVKVLAYASLQNISTAIQNLGNITVFSSATSSSAEETATSTASTTATTTIPTIPAVTTTATTTDIFTIENNITDAESTVSDGIDYLQANDYAHAYIDFQKALAEIQAVQAMLTASYGQDLPSTDATSTATTTPQM